MPENARYEPVIESNYYFLFEACAVMESVIEPHQHLSRCLGIKWCRHLRSSIKQSDTADGSNDGKNDDHKPRLYKDRHQL